MQKNKNLKRYEAYEAPNDGVSDMLGHSLQGLETVAKYAQKIGNARINMN